MLVDQYVNFFYIGRRNMAVPVEMGSFTLFNDRRRSNLAIAFFYGPHPVGNLPITVNLDDIYGVYATMRTLPIRHRWARES